MTRRTADPGRTRRALGLLVEELEEGGYLVSGGARPHVVRGRTCDCTDSVYHAGPCKHRVAVHLHERLHPSVRDALRALEEDR